MKGGLAAAAAAVVVGGANALSHHRHAHELFAKRDLGETCLTECTTIWTTITGEPTLVPNTAPPAPPATSSPPPAVETPVTPEAPVETPEAPVSSEVPATTSSPAPAPPVTTATPEVPVPTPGVHDCPTPGTYTFPATTVTVSKTTTVCGAETTKVPAGTHTVGGVTTVVETATTVTCPVAKVTTQEGGVVTSIIETTQYVCPTPGTYTIEPITTTVTQDTVLVYPVPTSYAPGTYTQDEQIVTVTETGYVYVCPFTSPGLSTSTAAPATSSAPAAAPPKETTTQAPAPTYEAPPKVETTSAPAPVVSSTKKTSSEAPKSTSTPNKPTGQLGSSNDHYGITYTPFTTDTGDCKAKDEIYKDVKQLKDDGFTVLRVYSTDCDTLPYVGGACKEYGMQMIVGVFVKETGCTYETPEIKEQVDELAKWDGFDMVQLFVVGNEAIMNGFCTASELRELITVVKTKCSGYTGPYTISETLNIWEQEDVASNICDVVDVTGANIHAYFNAETTPSKAGEFVSGQLDILEKICPGNTAINLECGWPTRGNCNGVACPGVDAQAEAISSIREAAGSKTVFFAYYDELWKEDGDCGCETSWGAAPCFQS